MDGELSTKIDGEWLVYFRDPDPIWQSWEVLFRLRPEGCPYCRVSEINGINNSSILTIKLQSDWECEPLCRGPGVRAIRAGSLGREGSGPKDTIFFRRRGRGVPSRPIDEETSASGCQAKPLEPRAL